MNRLTPDNPTPTIPKNIRMKNIHRLIHFTAAAALIALCAGCASTRRTEQMLTEAGFKPIVASTDRQAQHLNSLPADKLSVAKVNGKTFYVFPDPKRNRIYVGDAQDYHDYQQILQYSQIEGQNRVMAIEGQAAGSDEDKWVEWTSNSGWTHGTD
jgi:hypothetical protein